MSSFKRRFTRFLFAGAERRRFRWSSVVETLLFLAALLFLNHLVHPEYRGYLSVHPHPFWAIILFISIRYVFKESMLCALITASVYSFFIVFPAQGSFHFSALDLFSDFKIPLLFLIAAGLISGYAQHLVERTEVLRSQLRHMSQEMHELKDKNQAAAQALRRLEARIASEFTTILDLFEEAALIKQTSPAQIKRNLLEALVQYLNVEQCSYFDVERGHLVKSFSIGSNDEGQADHPPDQDILLVEALRSTQVAHLSQFAQQADLESYQGSSLMAGSLRSATGEVMGLVSIDKLPFIDYNPHSLKLFGTMLKWWSSILDEANRLRELRAKSVFNEELELYNYTYFAGRIFQEFERARRFSLPLSLSLVRINAFDQVPSEKVDELRRTLARIMHEMLTELEMASCYKDDALVAITFPIMMAVDAEERMGQLVEQIDAFAFHPYQDPEKSLSLSWSIADYEIGMQSPEDLISKVEQNLERLADSALAM